MELVPTQVFDDAKAFLAALTAPSDWTAAGAWYSPWVFRGQRDASWSLVPSAWRAPHTPPLQRLAKVRAELLTSNLNMVAAETVAAGRDKAFDIDRVAYAYAQGRAEFRLALEFVEMADRLGHPVPGMDRYMSLRKYNWVPELRHISHLKFVIEANSATALAQHHGIPTRFLDWTRSAATAAFFAASEVEEPTPDQSIAVWALRPDHLLVHGMLAVSGEDARRFLVYEVPRSENAYLRAQDGLFVYPAAACMHRIEYGEWPSLEYFALAVEGIAREPTIKKYTLPTSQVGELLRLLWLDGVSRAHLMPTYDNITSALINKWKWHP